MLSAREKQQEIIRKRYSNDAYNVVHNIDREILLRNLEKTVSPDELRDKTILEIGAGCSLFLRFFLEYGCKKLIANDLIEGRLKLNHISDERYTEIAGDFLDVDLCEQPDIVFSNLTMMFIIPVLDEFFAKIHRVLKPGGSMINSDPNYLCPISIYRCYSDRSGANPAKIFNPFWFAKKANEHGFIVEKLVPFTSKYPWTGRSWLLGTNFAMRARKPIAQN